jgi:polyhydroxybutyrate depolymerase
MPWMSRLLVTLVSASAIAMGCGADEGAPDTDALSDRLSMLEEAQDMLECACPGAEPCTSDGDHPVELGCFKQVAARHADEIGPELECQVRKVEAQNSCLQKAGCGDPTEAWETCYDEGGDCDDDATEGYEDEVEDCLRSAGALPGEGGESAGAGGAAGAGETPVQAGVPAPHAGSDGAGGTAGRGAAGDGAAGDVPGGAGMSGGGAGAGSGSAGSGGAGSAGSMTSAGCSSSDSAASGSFTLEVGGEQRHYVVTLPEVYVADAPHALVLAWHGLGGNAGSVAQTGYFGLHAPAGDAAIFVAGQGVPADGMDVSTTGWADADGADVAFTRAMLGEVRARYCIDEARIFSVGMSEGGAMSNRVGCALGDELLGIAAIAGSGPSVTCVGQVAAFIVHGTDDQVVHFTEGEASRDHWLLANHCAGPATPVAPEGCVEYAGCDDGHPVRFCEVDGGHLLPAFAGPAIWSFFSSL